MLFLIKKHPIAMTTFSTSLLKKSFLLCFAVCSTLLIQAKTFTVSNNPETPGQFGDINAALGSSLVTTGDTLLIQGSPISYGDMTVSKALTLIGPGHHPQKQNPLTATFSNISINVDNVKIYGLVVNGFIRAYDATNSSVPRINITISYCNVTEIRASRTLNFESPANNWFIFNNIVKRIINENGYAMLIHNNVITSYVRYCANSVSIKNNLFIGTGITQASIQSAPIGGRIVNNIFYNIGFYENANIGTLGNTVYQNNLTYTAGSSFLFPRGNGNIIEGNLENTNPLFINVPANTSAFSYDHNYRLQTTSPAHNAGNDGTDIGLYGLTPFSSTGELPQQPVIRTLSILNPNVPSGGALRVSATISRATTGN
jgi:hypothetical protein